MVNIRIASRTSVVSRRHALGVAVAALVGLGCQACIARALDTTRSTNQPLDKAASLIAESAAADTSVSADSTVESNRAKRFADIPEEALLGVDELHSLDEQLGNPAQAYTQSDRVGSVFGGWAQRRGGNDLNALLTVGRAAGEAQARAQLNSTDQFLVDRMLGEDPRARRLQTVNKPFNHHSPSLFVNTGLTGFDTFLGNAPRPWDMQPNTSYCFCMCISPLMSKAKQSNYTLPDNFNHIPRPLSVRRYF